MALDTTTKVIIRSLPPRVDPSVATMMEEQNETIKWSDIGGLNDQIREIREVDSLTTLDARSLSFPSQSPSSSSAWESRRRRAFCCTAPRHGQDASGEGAGVRR